LLRLWKVGHAARGRAATRLTLRWLLAGALVAGPAGAAESFVRNLAARALERGMAQEARGDLAQALTSYDEAVRTDSTLGTAALRLGALRERLGDREEAELLYSHAASSPDSSADAYYARALLRSHARRRAEAIADLAESVARAPVPERLRVLGGWYVEERRWSAALSVWRALQADATVRQDEARIQEAELTVTALSWLAGETDAVLAGSSSEDWARRSLSRAARPAKRSSHGVRKLTP
jgi:tetratricopeptide (TPR) repeat protein